jgi:hypothetical protein
MEALMPLQEVLLLAVTKMLAGVCVAGMSTQRDMLTGLRWVRPVREHGNLLLGDITTADGRVLQPFDVVAINLVQSRPQPPHAEDWIADLLHPRPCVLRCLREDRRAAFLQAYCDRDPCQVLDRQERSLCLFKPEWVKGCFKLDHHTAHFEARMSFGLLGQRYSGSFARGGHPVTDLKWRALGRAWLPSGGGWLDFDEGDLEARFGIREIYLAAGLTRSFRGALWPMIIGVHTVPDYEAAVDYDNL